MKTLAESLFDKDLVERDLPVFGDKYIVNCVLVCDDDYDQNKISFATKDDEYKWLLNTVKLASLKRDIKTPVKIDNKKMSTMDGEHLYGWRADERFCEVIGYILAIINEQPLVTDQYNIINPVNLSQLKTKLNPYLKNMKNGPRVGGVCNYYFVKRGTDEIMFELYRNDRKFIIVFNKKK